MNLMEGKYDFTWILDLAFLIIAILDIWFSSGPVKLDILV